MTMKNSKKQKSSFAKFALDEEFALLANPELQRPSVLDETYFQFGTDPAIDKIKRGDEDLSDE